MARCWTGPPRIPNFNLAVQIWFNYGGPIPPAIGPNVLTTGSIVPGEKTIGRADVAPFLRWLQLPALTDVHFGRPGIFGQDLVEIPVASGLFYRCVDVIDCGKGYANEYRIAVLFPLLPWPVPLP